MSFTAPQLPRELYGEANIRLGKIEAERNIHVMLAVESGSRAWGFPSADSDNDVRFFYTRPLPDYLGIEQPRDVVEQAIDGDWDINGWDLRKALGLLVKGNATVSEWLSSPLIYREKGPIPFKLRDLIKRYATAELSARHYYGLAKTCYEREIVGASISDRYGEGGHVNLKKYFYAVRAAAAICWVEKYGEVPPMSLPELMSHDTLPCDVRLQINDMIRAKQTMGEKLGFGPRIPILDDYVEQKVAWVKVQGFDKLGPEPDFVKAANSLLLEALGVAT